MRKVKNVICKVIIGVLISFSLHITHYTLHNSYAQTNDLEFTLDVNSNTAPLPHIFRPNIDLSGRGQQSQNTWPQELTPQETLDIWQNDIGFSGIYRLQYNLWEIAELAKDKDAQNKLLANYETIIKRISDAGGIVLLDIYGTPAGMGKVLDTKSPVFDLKAFKELVKRHMKNLSCDKRYNIWYEVWSAPDLDDFFLGRKQEYLNMYRAVAESAKELETEFKAHIPVGGPSVSWWFQNLDGNTIITPEKSLIYELIQFCYHYRLPLDFITWHAYSTDNKTEEEVTRYNKTAVELIKDWLSYFRFDKDIPLIIDEWNYDSGANVIPERENNAFVCSSFILSRINNMYESGLNYQLYFSLEDFYNETEGVIRNVGVFYLDPESLEYKNSPKSVYNVFRMLAALGNNMFLLPKSDDDFVGIIATRSQDNFVIIVYNYIDPSIATNYLSRGMALINETERRFLLNLFKNNSLEKIISQKLEISNLRPTNRLKTLFKKTRELNNKAERFKTTPRGITLNIKHLKTDYLYQKYIIDESCNLNCAFTPVEEKTAGAGDLYQDSFTLKPYSVNMIVLKPKPPEPKNISPNLPEKPVVNNLDNSVVPLEKTAPASTVNKDADGNKDKDSGTTEVKDKTP
ncbi:MAG: hypothetical protein V2A64_00430 [Candidatus Omnitrophota bacterium]